MNTHPPLSAGEESLGRSTPSELVVVADTREQRPLQFSSRVRVVRAALPVGDYAPLGYETRAAIERKSIADLVQSVTRERERFFRELKRLGDYEFSAVVIEGDMYDIVRRHYRSMATPRSVLASSLAIITDFAIPVLWAHSPDLAADCVEWMLHRFVRRAREVV